jgi:hypothetical protein
VFCTVLFTVISDFYFNRSTTVLKWPQGKPVHYKLAVVMSFISSMSDSLSLVANMLKLVCFTFNSSSGSKTVNSAF